MSAGFRLGQDYDSEPRVRQAIRDIYNAYGDQVSVTKKSKALNKFGRNLIVGTSFETVGEFQGTVANETFVTTNIVDSISSSSTDDDSQTIVIEGHTVDTSGNMTFVVQEADLQGQTKVTLSTPLARCNRLYVKPTGTFGNTPDALVGNVYVYDDTGGVGSGTPTVAAATKAMILAGNTQTEKCATTISANDYWLLSYISCAIGNTAGNAAFVTVRIETRDIVNGGAWRPLGMDYTLWEDTIGIQREFSPIGVIPKNHDVRVRAKSDSNTAEVYAEIGGPLAVIV